MAADYAYYFERVIAMVELSVEVDKDIYDEASKICEEFGTTLEEVTVAFLRFCIIPENLPKVKEILGIVGDPTKAEKNKGGTQ